MENPQSWQGAYRVVKPDGQIAHMRTRGVLAWSEGRW